MPTQHPSIYYISINIRSLYRSYWRFLGFGMRDATEALEEGHMRSCYSVNECFSLGTCGEPSLSGNGRHALFFPRMAIPHLTATRYVLPLREGGSLPAIVDADDGNQYVLKFRGAGQGAKALVAELIAAGLATALGLPVPSYALVELEDGFGEAEPNPEIQDLLRGSIGVNFGLAYLSGALAYSPAADDALVTESLASDVVWFDAFISNVDRTPQNPNLLVWHDKLWLIDHGAALYIQHGSGDWTKRAHEPFVLIEKHILLSRASSLLESDRRLSSLLNEGVIEALVADLPDEWLDGEPEKQRSDYVRYLLDRLEGRREWLQEAENARRRR